ncbi:MAG: transcription termination factor Rho [Phycisphaerae bacterium]|nr:transcription termination factor Rho [Phycisphaerae bacterium]
MPYWAYQRREVIKLMAREKLVKGVLEYKGTHGYLRCGPPFLKIMPDDPFICRDMLQRYRLREGLEIEAKAVRKKGRKNYVTELVSIYGLNPYEYNEIDKFENFTVIDPNEVLHLETGPEPLGMRVIDLLTPIGKGQRGLIVAPPRTGKTVLLQQIANSITTNYPKAKLMIILVDERPEEVTDICRSVSGEVYASSNDKTIDNHVRVARVAMEKAKRMVEYGNDVVVLLDSITRLGRAFNSWGASSGRTMSGGLDVRALQLPKQIFGSARNIEGGGSLTIIATALIETGSRMDDIIFNEFKGTGNMELVLDQKVANQRVYPAINISESGTRKEELLIGKQKLAKIIRLRRHLYNLPFGKDVDMMLKALKQHSSNDKFLAALP